MTTHHRSKPAPVVITETQDEQSSEIEETAITVDEQDEARDKEIIAEVPDIFVAAQSADPRAPQPIIVF